MIKPNPRTPVLVGVAQYTDRDSAPQDALSPVAMLANVGKAALADSGGQNIKLDAIAVVKLFADSSPAFKAPFGHYTNLPRSLANQLAQTPERLLYGPVGGNTPQMLVNMFAEDIRTGKIDSALIAGCEPLRSQAKGEKAGIALDWSEDTGDLPETLGKETYMISRHEAANGIALPVSVYPIFENALGAHYGRSPLEQRAKVGELMHRFTQVAAKNPYAALPIERSAEELITPGDDNRYIGYPYTKYLNSNMFVDQAAAVLLMSTEAADAARVPEAQRVYLHGSADTHENILVSNRVNYWSAPAIRIGAAQALKQAGVTTADLAYIDIYSCFPVAVEIAADMIGLKHDDPRGLTLTGGLPYFGGPGNNYSMHGIAEAVAHCRAEPGSWGFVSANGGYLTKHSFGVYSTVPANDWARIDPQVAQDQVDALTGPEFTETPSGSATIEAFTVMHDKGRPAFGIVIGRLDEGNVRFLAQVRDNLEALIDKPVIGRKINVTTSAPANIAQLA
jgi:acetyl-CoA C-acetyltransferase